MARYKINHRYQSSVIGLDEGAVVDLDDTLAEWLERDSPGLLTATEQAEAPAPEPETDPEPEPEAEPDPADVEAEVVEEPKPKRGRAKA